MKKICNLISLIFITANCVVAQTPAFTWAKQIGGTSHDQGKAIAVDSSGNVYTTGIFQGTADFDPGAGTFNMTSAGGNDIFISKLDASGNFVWAKQIGGTGADQGTAIALDASGNVYTTGFFANTADFDPGAGSFPMTSLGTSNVFISKLNSAGNFIWAKQFGGGASDAGSGYGIKLDNSGNSYITGNFGVTFDFDPNAGVYNITAYGGDAFVAKLDAAGNLVWAKQFGGAGAGCGSYAIALDATGNVYSAGNFNTGGPVDFDPGAGTFTMSASNGSGYISKLDGSGNFVWAKQFGGVSVNIWAIAVNGNNLYSTGDFDTATDFDPGAGSFTMTPLGLGDIFICKLDLAGSFIWAKQIGGPGGGNNYGSSIAVDNSGNVYTCGNFAGTIDLDPGAGIFNITQAGSSADGYLSKLDALGNYVWGGKIGSTTGDAAYSISLDANRYIYATGYFQLTVDFDVSAGVFNQTSAGIGDTYIVKYCQAPEQASVINGSTNACIGSPQTYSISALPGATSYIWSLPGGWSGSSITDSINVIVGGTGGNITVTANNACGSSTPQTLAITVNTIPATPGTISGTTAICSGSSNTYSVTNDPSATSYTWTVPGGWAGTSTTNSINTTASATSGNITVTANNACGSSSPQTLTITVNTIPSTPGTISGTTTICSGSSNTYSVTNDPSATSYTWTLPGGWSGTSTTNSINTTASATSGNITVIANNPCGSSALQTLAITVNIAPSTPGLISGLTTICSGSSNTYSVTNDPSATSYTWTFPSGWTGTSTTNSINATASSTSGNITVTANNACGNSTPQTLAVTVNALPNVTANATDNNICDGDPTTLTGGNAVSYTWTGGVTDGVAFNPSATLTYTVTGTDVNTCTNTATITITVNNLPTVNFNYTGPDTICTSYGLQTLSGGTPAGGIYSGTGVTGTNFDPNIAGVGNHIITYSFTDVNNCTNTDVFTIIVIGCAGIENNDESSIVVYPNPFTNFISVTGISEGTEVKLYNSIGQMVKNWMVSETNQTLNTENLASGIYFLCITLGGNEIVNKIIRR